MPSRAELELRAAACNVTATSYPNDSTLEQAVLYAEKNMTAQAGTATTQAPSAASVAQTSGDANVQEGPLWEKILKSQYRLK